MGCLLIITDLHSVDVVSFHFCQDTIVFSLPWGVTMVLRPHMEQVYDFEACFMLNWGPLELNGKLSVCCASMHTTYIDVVQTW